MHCPPTDDWLVICPGYVRNMSKNAIGQQLPLPSSAALKTWFARLQLTDLTKRLWASVGLARTSFDKYRGDSYRLPVPPSSTFSFNPPRPDPLRARSLSWHSCSHSLHPALIRPGRSFQPCTSPRSSPPLPSFSPRRSELARTPRSPPSSASRAPPRGITFSARRLPSRAGTRT